MNSGSFDNLKVSQRWGCRANARQMRPTVAALSPHTRAIERVLQCVASRGIDSRVVVTTRSTSASDTVRGVPGRASSSKPSQPDWRNRRRHFPTVTRVVPNSAATAKSLFPAALASTIRARRASAWAVFGRRTQRSSSSRCMVLSLGIARVW